LATPKLLIAFAGLGIFFLFGTIIWWVIIYPILLLNGWINSLFEWGDNKRRDDDDGDDSAVASMRHTLLLLSTLYYLFCWSENSPGSAIDEMRKSNCQGVSYGTRDRDSPEPTYNSLDFSGFETDLKKVKEIQEIISVMNTTKRITFDIGSIEAIYKSETVIRTVPYINFMGERCVVLLFRFTKEFRGCGTAYHWQFPLSLDWAI
jgi:hypothetical protein